MKLRIRKGEDTKTICIEHRFPDGPKGERSSIHITTVKSRPCVGKSGW
jgi:hypothetical protein